ncbi:hypothetical protein B0T18DRAFT_430430 [Schizothecium vesticola]|uniref:Uncharacterized protein n=1 Tax=Schizothecium vesticola TaxID=314040 RepID=A0AA40K210_9PEZI|nr:hypothetical protein B0T18DRAFT_430430 [Schizothecium vesticola]
MEAPAPARKRGRPPQSKEPAELVRRDDKVIATGCKVEKRLGAYMSDSLRLLELNISADRVALAAKAGLSAFVESLHKEIRPLGLHALAIEYGGFPTSLSQARDGAPPPPPPTQIADYAPGLTALGGIFASDPTAYIPSDLARAIRIVLGSDAHAAISQKVREVAGLLEEWKDVSYSTDSDAHADGATKEYLEAVSILEKEQADG